MAAVRPIELSEIREARKRIASTIVRTPLLRLELGPGFPDIRLKLENLQPINAYKLRGAANAVAMLSDAERERGVWTISAGNAGQGVAYAARKAGVPSTVVAIETAPTAKLERMRALGAKLILVSYEVAWQALEARAYPGAEGTFVHPFDDDNFIAGHGTMGLEILEDAPDTAAVRVTPSCAVPLIDTEMTGAASMTVAVDFETAVLPPLLSAVSVTTTVIDLLSSPSTTV